jgi:hypothetical protein
MNGRLQRTFASAARFRKLRGIEQSVFVTAVFAMVAARLALVFIPMRRILSASLQLGRRWPVRRGHQLAVASAAKRIVQATQLCPMSTCLSEAIAAQFVMARLGFECEVRIGVAKTQDKFEAHAWLECPEHIVIGDPAPHGKHYSELPSLRSYVA